MPSRTGSSCHRGPKSTLSLWSGASFPPSNLPNRKILRILSNGPALWGAGARWLLLLSTAETARDAPGFLIPGPQSRPDFVNLRVCQ